MRTKGLIIACLVGIGAGALPAARRQGKEPAVKRLLRPDPVVREGAKAELVAARAKLISDLIAIVENAEYQEKNAESVMAAILVLGDMRASEASEVLAKNAAFPRILRADGSYKPYMRLRSFGDLRPMDASSPRHWPSCKASAAPGFCVQR